MAKLTIIGPNLPDQSKGGLHVHTADCKDLTRGQYRQVPVHEKCTEEHNSLRSIVESFYTDIIDENNDTWGEYLNEFWFAPCVDALHLPEECYDVELKFRFTLNFDKTVTVFTREEFPTWENFGTYPNLEAAGTAAGEEIALRVARQQDGTE